MLDRLFNLIADISETPQETFGDDDYRLAAAALLVHVMSVDGRVSEAERERIRSVLSDGFELSETETTRLIENAVTAEAATDSWTSFADLLAKRLDENGRRRIVGMMWSVVLADGAAAEMEEAVVERAAALMGVEAPVR